MVTAVHDRIFIYPDALWANFYIEISNPKKQCMTRWFLLRQATTLELLRTNHRSFSTWLHLELIVFSKQNQKSRLFFYSIAKPKYCH